MTNCHLENSILQKFFLGEEQEVKERLNQAISNDEFVLYYQPIHDINKGVITRIEALIRWNHPECGLIYPNDFIPLFEKSGLIIPLGNFILYKACEDTKSLHNIGYEDMKI